MLVSIGNFIKHLTGREGSRAVTRSESAVAASMGREHCPPVVLAEKVKERKGGKGRPGIGSCTTVDSLHPATTQ